MNTKINTKINNGNQIVDSKMECNPLGWGMACYTTITTNDGRVWSCPEMNMLRASMTGQSSYKEVNSLKRCSVMQEKVEWSK